MTKKHFKLLTKIGLQIWIGKLLMVKVKMLRILSPDWVLIMQQIRAKDFYEVKETLIIVEQSQFPEWHRLQEK